MTSTGVDFATRRADHMTRSTVRVRRCLAILVMGWAFGTGMAGAQQTSSTAIQRQQQAQLLAEQLVSGILDLQLRQLKENGLERLPVYAEIASMRHNLHQLVDRDMRQVVERLIRAERENGAAQNELRRQARVEIREIVVRLMAERLKLEQRLQVSRLAAQVRQLLDLQQRLHQRTQSLTQQENRRRQQLTVRALADQDDVAAVFDDLLRALRQVGSWGGTRAAAALDGLQILRAGAVEEGLQQAATALRRADFDTATQQQSIALEGLTALLQRLDRDRGVERADREETIVRIRGLIVLQEALRDETRRADSGELAADAFVQRQTDIHQSIMRLEASIAGTAGADPLWQRAVASSFEAAEHLFSTLRSDALREQAAVIGSLAQLAEQLRAAGTGDSSEMSSTELAASIRRLEALGRSLKDTIQSHEQWVAEATANRPDQAFTDAKPYRANVPQVPAAERLPTAVEAALENAQDQATELVRLTTPPRIAEPTTLQSAVDQTGVAIRQTQAEVQSHLSDLRRRQLSVEVGEIARAAESLERAAAAERILAEGPPPGIAAPRQAAEQRRIASVASDIARGVATSAPRVTGELEALGPALEVAQTKLLAGPAPSLDPAPRGRATDPETFQLSTALTAAAATLRTRQDQVASELAKLAEQQLIQLRNVRGAIEEQSPDGEPEAGGTAVAPLQQALRAVSLALIAQLRASGHPQAADAQQASAQIDALQRRQLRLGFEHLDNSASVTSAWSELAIEQRQVCELLQNMSGSVSAPFVAAVERGSQAAAKAARMALSGNRRGYRTAHHDLVDALSTLGQLTHSQVQQASQATAETFDLESQQQVTAHATEARRAILNLVPTVAQGLEEIESASRLAVTAIRDADTQRARQTQSSIQQELRTAQQQLREAILQTGQRELAQWGPLAQRVRRLAERAAAIDAPATAALNQTLAAIREGQRQPPDEVELLVARRNAIQRGLDRAVAGLASREARIRRDREIAESLAALARDQQVARQDIARHARRLNEITAVERHGSDRPTPPVTPAETETAEALADAARRFASTQRSTGEGAVKISGQQRVANPDIRRGLETASRLQSPFWSQKASAGQQPSATGQTNRQETQNGSQPQAPTDRSKNAPGQPAARDGPGTAAEATAKRGDDPSQSSAKGLGTGLIPDSPETTADQIAGPQAMQAASRAKAAGSSPASARGQANNGKTESAAADRSQADSSQPPSASPAGDAQAGRPGSARASRPGQGNPQQANAAEPTAEAATRRLEKAPWFAKLPSQLREALRSRPRREAPRGYRERLRRYFQSVD